MPDLKVIVQMITYNHAPFIRQAIDSIMMQETDFPFQLLICDDRSTDRTGEICRELADRYGDRIRLVINETNLGMAGNAYQIIRMTTESGVPYVAACEGDDYWTDSRKLQKQVDFLDRHPDYSVCWTRYAHDKDGVVEPLDWSDPIFQTPATEITPDNIFYISRTNTLTVVWRNSAMPFLTYSSFHLPKDIVIYSILLSKGKGALLNFDGANYRLHEGGMYSSVGEFNRNFQNYLALKEIIEKIPAFDIKPLHIKMMWSLERAIHNVCGGEMDDRAYSELLRAHKELMQVAPLRRKLTGIKEVAMQSLRHLRHRMRR